MLYAAPFGSSRLAGRPELGGAALDGVAVRALKVAAAAREGCPCRGRAISHAHVNSVGRYDLTAKPPQDGRLRPLRQAPVEASGEIPTPPLGVTGDKH